MKNLNFQKIQQLLRGQTNPWTFESVAACALWLAVVLLGILMILDGYVFYQYSYLVVNQHPASGYRIALDKKRIQEFVTILTERQKKFENIRTGTYTLPTDPFR